MIGINDLEHNSRHDLFPVPRERNGGIPKVADLFRLVRFCALFALAYVLGCMLMVAATPKAQRFDCHGKAQQVCFDEMIQSRRKKDPTRHLLFWRASIERETSAEML